MNIDERYHYITERLKQEKKISSKGIAKDLNVSFETIRRDFEKLETLGRLKRVHGGAVYSEPKSDVEKTFIERENLFADEKKIIAKKAMDFVEEGISIALDVSTTNTAIARQLVKKFTRLTIITNSLPIIDIVAKVPTFTVIVPGGILYNQERCIIGDKAIEHIGMYNIDLFFMSLSGIDLNKGLTDYGHEEMKVKMAFLNQAMNTIIVADHSKFDTVSLIRFADVNSVSRIITDNSIDNDTKQRYANVIEII